MFSLIHAAHALEGRLESVLGERGLSLARFGVLDQLVRAGEPLPLSELASRLSCVRSNITQLVDRLEVDGLVHRVDDPADRRSIRAALTPAGEERHADARDLLRAEQRRFAAEVPLDVRATLEDLLAGLS